MGEIIVKFLLLALMTMPFAALLSDMVGKSDGLMSRVVVGVAIILALGIVFGGFQERPQFCELSVLRVLRMAGFSAHRQGSEAIDILVFDLGLGSNYELVSSESHDRVDRRRSTQRSIWPVSRVDLHGRAVCHFKRDLRRDPSARAKNSKNLNSRPKVAGRISYFSGHQVRLVRPAGFR